jgi:metallo-beta-lactamase class B
VLVSHAHLDHAGGAKFLQEKYGARILMSAADWDLLEQQNPPWKPKRDMVVTDGQKLTLGDTTLTMYITPGHTPGTVSSIVPVFDNGQRHIAAAWGGTAFNFGPDKARLQTYAASAARFRDIVTKAGADVPVCEPHRLRRHQDEDSGARNAQARWSAPVCDWHRCGAALCDRRQRMRAGSGRRAALVESTAETRLPGTSNK